MSPNKNNHSAWRSIKYKLRVGVSLMSVLPILISVYFVFNFIFPQEGTKIDILLTVLIGAFIAFLGFILVKQIFDRVLSVSSEARLIIAGDVNRKLNIPREDEVGDLGEVLNQLTARIRSNMDELKNYGEKTTQINMEIQKRVLVLSSLLQISSLVSQGASLEDILKITIQKACLLANSEAAYMLFKKEDSSEFCMKVADGPQSQYLMGIRVKDEGPHAFTKLVKDDAPFIIDKNHPQHGDLHQYFSDTFRYKNMLVFPIYVRAAMMGVLGIANNKDAFVFKKEDIELLDIFAKQVAIAVENDILMHRVEKLEIKDVLTGLYNNPYILNRLQEEIRRAIAYQRPCAFILFDIDDFKKFYDTFGLLQSEVVLKRISSLIKDSVSDIDRVARFSDNEFAVVLPEKNKRQAQDIAEVVRKRIEFAFSEEHDTNRKITVSGGVAENPLDGITSQELVAKAEDLLKSAKVQGKNRVLSIK